MLQGTLFMYICEEMVTSINVSFLNNIVRLCWIVIRCSKSCSSLSESISFNQVSLDVISR